MDIEQFRSYCLHMPGSTEDTPFGPDTLVFKVKGKMFALCSIDEFGSVNLKCDPERSIELREKFPQITPGYHMNKQHWNSVVLEGLPHDFIKELIRHSYSLVKDSLSKKLQKEIELGI
ncbi:MAG TPA: MmcQ/YjbR family DNA-binding protein [Bacteroidia bacterium]